jgi:hypothetical protein
MPDLDERPGHAACVASRAPQRQALLIVGAGGRRVTQLEQQMSALHVDLFVPRAQRLSFSEEHPRLLMLPLCPRHARQAKERTGCPGLVVQFPGDRQSLLIARSRCVEVTLDQSQISVRQQSITKVGRPVAYAPPQGQRLAPARLRLLVAALLPRQPSQVQKLDRGATAVLQPPIAVQRLLMEGSRPLVIAALLCGNGHALVQAGEEQPIPKLTRQRQPPLIQPLRSLQVPSLRGHNP